MIIIILQNAFFFAMYCEGIHGNAKNRERICTRPDTQQPKLRAQGRVINMPERTMMRPDCVFRVYRIWCLTCDIDKETDGRTDRLSDKVAKEALKTHLSII